VPRCTYGTVNELDVLWALGVTVSSTVCCTSLVGREPRGSTIGVHLGEVKRTVETATKVGHVNVEGELLVEQLQHLISLVGGVHEINTRANIGLRTLGNEVEAQRIAASCNTISAYCSDV
jgi:hypothetical protein